MRKVNVQWSDDDGRRVPIRRRDISVRPLINAIKDPSLEVVRGLSDLGTKEMVDVINTFSSKFVHDLAIENPNRKGQFGFILNPRAFGFPESENRLAEVMSALLNRLGETKNLA
ncbi:MAG: hypothetical protein Q7R93_05395 [bacterium]|nr:hypothetical protein [bacterium]